MKIALTFLALLACSCSVLASENGMDDLSVRVVLTTGERSKDSSSQTTTINVTRSAISWERAFSGRGGRVSPSRKEFKLSSAQMRTLLKLVRSNSLLVTDSIELPRDSSNYMYFEISVDLSLGEKKGAINISGPRNAATIKEEKLYQNTLTLVEELYRIMSGQDKSIRFEELIKLPRMTSPPSRKP